MPLINKCFTEFQESYRNKPYERQKDSLEGQLSSFLHSLVPPKKVSAATTEDIVKFWLARMPWENKNYMKRLVATTVNSHIGELRVIFNRLGRSGFSNPLAHPSVKEYLKFVREEQAQQPLLLHQAVPLFYDKFTSLIACLRNIWRLCHIVRLKGQQGIARSGSLSHNLVSQRVKW